MAAPKGNKFARGKGTKTALERFAEKCAFDPVTGCVMWIGGRTSGRGQSQPVYGTFWDQGRRWSAHRWAGVHIHGLDLSGTTGDHNCPHGPRTLCVEHIQASSVVVNSELRHSRPGIGAQDNATKQYWIFVAKGIEQPPPDPEIETPDIPFYSPPAWLAPFLEKPDDCPF